GGDRGRHVVELWPRCRALARALRLPRGWTRRLVAGLARAAARRDRLATRRARPAVRDAWRRSLPRPVGRARPVRRLSARTRPERGVAHGRDPRRAVAGSDRRRTQASRAGAPRAPHADELRLVLRRADRHRARADPALRGARERARRVVRLAARARLR